MNRNDGDRRTRGSRDEPEIEILEVVGLDEDLPPSSEAAGGDDGDVDEHEVEVLFDDHDAEADDRADGDAPSGPTDVVSRERFHRLQAEFENLKKRVEREKDEFYRHATSTLVGRLLPVLDNFERALLHADDDGGNGAAFRDGVRLIHKQLLDELARQGLRPVESVGRPFDPTVHEAMATEPDDEHPPNTVLQEFQRGYFFHDRLLRPAMVKVSVEDGADTSAPDDPDDASEA